jgi:hypothetical protein
MSLLPTAATAAAALVPLQELPASPELAGGPIGNLLVALVVIALVLFVGRFVLSVAWRILKVAIVVVGLAWLFVTVAPMLGL